jgi:hypothetical protein
MYLFTYIGVQQHSHIQWPLEKEETPTNNDEKNTKQKSKK